MRRGIAALLFLAMVSTVVDAKSFESLKRLKENPVTKYVGSKSKNISNLVKMKTKNILRDPKRYYINGKKALLKKEILKKAIKARGGLKLKILKSALKRGKKR